VYNKLPERVSRAGTLRHRPDRLLGDRSYDAAALRQALRARHIVPWLAKPKTEHGSGLGRWRWVVETNFPLAEPAPPPAFAMRSEPTSTKRFWPWLALSSARTLSKGTTEE
jgi:hypothetical protein